jgi:shikimate dehydrogenase
MTEVFTWRDAPKAQFAVLGDPVGHSLSPQMHQAAFQALSLPYRYVAIRVPEGELARALDHLGGMGYVGVNLTLPHKEAALEWVTEPDAFVRRAGAVNTVRLAGKSGINTDAPGFLDTLEDLKVEPPGPVLVLGAGGAARAISTALVDAGYKVKLYNRTPKKAKELVASTGIKATVASAPDPSGIALIVNATSASVEGDALKIDWSSADRKTIAYDLMYGPELSPFLLEAGLAGLKVVDGLEMLIRQGARALEWWLGCKAPVEEMRRAVR